MVKKLLGTLLCLIAHCTITNAALTVSSTTNGITLTLNATGDLATGFSGLNQTQKNATTLIIKTAGGATMNQSDIETLKQFSHLHTLDLTDARVTSDHDLQKLREVSTMKRLTFPKTSTQIPTDCFQSHSACKIEEITFPDNPNAPLTLSQQALRTTSLKKITFGSRQSITIGNMCFLDDTGLTMVDFRYGTKTIKFADMAFKGTTNLRKIILPEGLTEISEYAFAHSGIRAIRLPSTLKTIKTKAFAYATELRSITIPEGVTQIEHATFENNYNLGHVYVLGTETKCAEGAFTDNDTYRFRLYNYTNGQKDVKVSDYTREDSNMKTCTVLHFKKEAYDNYVNEYVKVIGTDKYNSSPYGSHPELNHWVFDSKGNKWPVDHSSYFEGEGRTGNDCPQGDYAGWKDFMLTDNTLSEQMWIDPERVGDKWYTMCLPFDMTEEQLQSAYGADVEVVEFSAVALTTETNGKKRITLEFKTPVTSTKAHHPYFIHPGIHAGKEKGVKTTIAGITKQPEEPSKLEEQKVSITTDGVTYTFKGNYDKNKGLEQYSYYYYSGEDTKWPNAFYKWVAASGGTWNPYTACVLLSKDNGAYARLAPEFYSASSDSHTTTGISSIMPSKPMAEIDIIYNINGQIVSRGDIETLQSLPQGIYILNGKKYIMR
uniref:Leucine-rich repeat domain-containing protein n=1 Tax=Prevotella sp. GTC17260 TaxID=3236796 RepID=A0AB33J6Y3_9BACT